jgi:hypothetical protein
VTASFQAYGGQQGRQFAQQCDALLVSLGFVLGGSAVLPKLGVEIDQAATSKAGRSVWFEYKGSVQGTRPGLLRTDTLKKAIANGALIQRLVESPPFVVLTSHVPNGGAGRAMLDTALELGYFADVVCLYDPGQIQRLAVY